jgi:6-phosphogluconolactonase
MRRFRSRLTVGKPGLAAVFALVLAISVSAATGAAAAPSVIGYVYVNDNTVGVNTIAGFARQADGTLTPLAGSPFAAGGNGTGAGIASQGALQLSSDGRYLLAVDAGSNQISVLQIEQGGALQPVGAPVSSNGVDPVSIAVWGGLVYVANQGPGTNPGDTNYTGFTLNPGGHLNPISGSTYALANSSKPGDVLFSGDGTRLVGTRIASSQIDSFTVGSDGLLTPASGSPYSAQGFSPGQGYGQLGSEFSPTNPDQLYVSDAHVSPAQGSGGATPGLVSSFTDAANGDLSLISPSPVSNPGTASCWVEITHDGLYLFVVNTGSGTIASYSIGAGGTLTYLQSTPSGEIGAGAEDARLSPDGSTLWVVDAGVDKLSSFAVNGGTLTELAQSPTPLPTGAAPAGVVVTETNLQGSNLQGANLEGANLPDANVQGANLQNANLKAANLQDANLQGSNLQGVNGQGTNFIDAELQGANLQHGTFTNANFDGASLQGDNLQGDNLTNATLANSNLNGDNLQNANLTGATLAGATVTGANLQNVTWSNTTCPDGTNSNADGGTCQSHL